MYYHYDASEDELCCRKALEHIIRASKMTDSQVPWDILRYALCGVVAECKAYCLEMMRQEKSAVEN